MKHKLIVAVDCGKLICGCCHKRTSHFCDVFNVGLFVVEVKGGGARYARCPQCLAAERAAKRGK